MEDYGILDKNEILSHLAEIVERLKRMEEYLLVNTNQNNCKYTSLFTESKAFAIESFKELTDFISQYFPQLLSLQTQQKTVLEALLKEFESNDNLVQKTEAYKKYPDKDLNLDSEVDFHDLSGLSTKFRKLNQSSLQSEMLDTGMSTYDENESVGLSFRQYRTEKEKVSNNTPKNGTNTKNVESFREGGITTTLSTNSTTLNNPNFFQSFGTDTLTGIPHSLINENATISAPTLFGQRTLADNNTLIGNGTLFTRNFGDTIIGNQTTLVGNQTTMVELFNYILAKQTPEAIERFPNKSQNESDGQKSSFKETTIDDIKRTLGSTFRKAPTPTKEKEYVLALYDFAGGDNNELSFSKGARMTVLNDDVGQGWMECEMNGQRGLVPKQYKSVFTEPLPASLHGSKKSKCRFDIETTYASHDIVENANTENGLGKPVGCWSRFQNSLHQHYLSSGVSAENLLAYLFAVMMGVCFFVFINIGQASVLTYILKIDKSVLGESTGMLPFFDQLLTIVALSDVWGRRVVYSLGFLIMSIGLGLYPWATNLYTPFYSSLVFFRLIFAFGSSACSSMMTAVLSDYAHQKSRGRVSGSVGLVSGLGAVIGALVLPRLPNAIPPNDGAFNPIRITFLIAAGLSLFSSLIVGTFLQKKFIVPESDASPKRTVFSRLIEGFVAAKNPAIFLAYLGGYLARSDSIVITTFIPSWVTKHYLSVGECLAEEDLCSTASRLYSTLTGVAQVCALFGAPFYGIFADRISRHGTFLFGSFIGIFSFGSFFFIKTPTSWLVYVASCFSGLAQIGMIVTSMSLVSAFAPPEKRGSISGVYSLFGGIGILFNSRIGGYLFDSWNEGSPFLLISASHILGLKYHLSMPSHKLMLINSVAPAGVGPKVYFPQFVFAMLKRPAECPPNIAIFKVNLRLTKYDIRNYLEAIYNIRVLRVDTVRYMAKEMKDPLGRKKTLPAWKKAFVYLDKEWDGFPEEVPQEEFDKSIKYNA
ncbi:MFS general substrate transporter [Rozella allomycis CSF55]|uniref:MFS general substrate transporter n=1 Tax=Rozella allomycis (strain CSF55) TaxID=988480 RepID=A0A4P9YMI9_ROZAC|nr:MFS general substrate transporter [Rozella allomycis CSF55]